MFEVISSDSHVVEPADLWAKRLPTRYRDQAPQLAHVDGADFFQIGGVTIPLAGCAAATGARFEKAPQPMALAGSYENVRPGGANPEAMLQDMDLDGVYAQVLYPTEGLGFFSIPDGELLSALFAAYNDWLADFVATNPQRLKGVALINLDDVPSAVQELERAAKLGLAGAAIAVAPLNTQPYADPAYEPLWAAAAALRLPLSFHAGTERPAPGRDPYLSTTPESVRLCFRGAIETSVKIALGDMILAGVFQRYPELQVGSIEHGGGWIPYWLWQLDTNADLLRIVGGSGGCGDCSELPAGVRPSDYFRRNMFVSFQEDPFVVAQRDRIGIDNLTFGTDYPHVEGTFPKTREVLQEFLAGCTPEESAKIAGQNTARIYSIRVPSATGKAVA